MRLPLLVACAAALAAAQAVPAPHFEHSQVVTVAPSASLEAALKAAEHSAGPRWWGYRVPALTRHRSDCGVAYLEGDDLARTQAEVPAGPQTLVVLLRLQAGAVSRVRSFVSPQCTIDAGGLTLDWLGDVDSQQSVALLASLAQGPQPPANGALSALALSADPAAVDALIRDARTNADPKQRGQALFWLAQRAGDKAVGAISQAIADDPDTAVKERAVFGLSQLPHGQGVPLLIQLAKSNANPAVRKRAMFWLGQSKDPRAVDFFQSVLEH